MTADKRVSHDDLDNQIDLDQARARRPVLAGPNGTPLIERIGLHWEASFPGDLHFKLEHLTESRDEFKGELTVDFAPAGTVGGRLAWTVLNLTSTTARATLAKQLSAKVDADWVQFLEVFCYEVVQRERRPTATIEYRAHTPRETDDWLLEPILPTGLPTVLYGPGGVGKSTLACAMAFSVASGCVLIEGWKPLSAPVLILDWEGRGVDWTERWQAIARGQDMAFPEFHYRPCRRRLKDDVEYVAEEIGKYHVGLVVVDSVSLAFGTSSYADADPADSAIKAFAAIRELGDITWLLIDHVTGSVTEGDNVAAKAYGSVKKRDLARQMFHVAGARESSSTRQELVVTHTKANYSMRMRPMGVVLKRATMPDGESLTFQRSIELQAPELVEKLSMAERVLQLLALGKLSPERMRDKLGIEEKDRKGRAHLQTVVNALRRQQKVTLLPSGEVGLMTIAGEQAEMLP